MAAVGAPEVITQLESAAKVLMVRNSTLFCSRGEGDTYLLTLPRVGFGGWRLPRLFASSRFLLIMCSVFTGGALWERCVAPCLTIPYPGSLHPVQIRSPSITFPVSSFPSFLSWTAATTLVCNPGSGLFPARLSCPETSAARVAVLSAVNVPSSCAALSGAAGASRCC